MQQISKAKEAMQNKKSLKVSKDEQARTLSEMMARTAAKQAEFDMKVADMLGTNSEDTKLRMSNETASQLGQQSRRAYLRELKKVVESADVILQVLDARDPNGSRASTYVENMILSHPDKRMVLVLNKVDLVPKEAVSGWLTVLRRSMPALAVKAATNMQDDRSCGARAKGDSALKGSAAVGVEGLLQLLKNYARSSCMKKKGNISVGIIGYPNVGKSSILNSLKRARAVGVSPRPGFTTCMQEVVLDKNIRLLDSPGIVFDDVNNGGVDVLLRNCINTDSMSDPLPAIKGLITRCSQERLMMTYALPSFPPGDENIFLGMIAKKFGKVRRGGIPDKVAAAKLVLSDWNNGKVPFYTPPPLEATESHKAGLEGTAKVVKKFDKDFDIMQMRSYDDALMEELEDSREEYEFVQLGGIDQPIGNSVGLVEESMDDNSDQEMEMESESKVSVYQNAKVANAEDYDFSEM